MSLTPSYEGESASASPESPGEGDFSSRQFYDNSKSLEEHETCDERGPIVNKVPDNYSSAPLKAPICASLMTNDLENERAGISSEEQIEKDTLENQRIQVHCWQKETSGLITFNGGLHTGWKIYYSGEHSNADRSGEGGAEPLFQLSSSKGSGDLQMLPDEMIMDTVPVYLKETEDDETEEEYDVPCPGLPRLIAYRREPKQTLRISKLLEVEPEKSAPLAPCEYCQKLCQPFTLSESLKNETHFDRAFYCQEAKQIRELIQREKEKLEMKYYSRMIYVDTYRSTSRQEWETPKEPQGRVKHLQQRRKPRKWENSGLTTIQTEMRFQLPIPAKNAEIAGGTLTTLPTLDETYAEPKLKDVTQKFYKTGTCFRIMYSDGTGTVLRSYPSGKPAIVISSAEGAHFTYIILEDKDTDPSIKGIFATKGYSTCYHSNGLIWLNLTSGGGLCFSETGNLRRRWNWLYCDPHVHNLPFKPLTFALGPHISVGIHSQECVYVSFVHKENHVRFSVGSKLELICPESHDKSGQSILERFIQTKKTEIYSLLDQMQTCMSRPTANVQKIKPHYRFIAQKERLSKQVEKEKSPKKIKAHAN